MNRRHTTVFAVVLLSLAGLGVPASLWSQTVRSSITGLVRDSSGAVIVGATVTVTNQGTGSISTAKSESDGNYLVPDLLPGVYKVSGEASGFERLTVTGLNLDVSTTLTQDLILQIGKTSQTISVAGTASLVETTTNMEGTTIDGAHITELPIADRQIMLLINLAPGVTFQRANDNPGSNRAASGNGPGSNGFSLNATLDGNDLAGAGSGNFQTQAGGGTVQPPPDSVQEFRVETNNLSAEYGRGGTLIVNEVTKSGTNQFHGDVYDFFRNSAFDTAGWGNTIRPLLQQNTAGGTIGGPIRKDKTFFFFSYEYLLNNIAGTTIDNVGLPAFRTGDFTHATADEVVGGVHTAVLVPVYDPATYNAVTKTNRQISCNGVLNMICPNRINSVASAMVPFMVQPNQTPLDPLSNADNFQIYTPATDRRPFYMGRVDEQLNSSNKLFFRFVVQPQRLFQALGNSGFGGPLATNAVTTQRDQNYVLNFSHLFSPTFFVNFSPGVDRSRLILQSTEDLSVNYAAKFGIGNVPGPGVPYMSFSGGQVPVDGFGGPTYRGQNITYSNFPVNFTKLMGKHTLKFGAQLEWFDSNTFTFSDSGGQFNFNGTYTQGVVNGTAVQNTGINFADFLLGYFSSTSISQTPSNGLRSQMYAFYVQDDWRVTPNLTLNLGLRYETNTPFYSSINQFQSFNPFVPNPGAGTGSIPAGAMGETIFQGLNGQGKYLYNWFKKPFAPRFGFAYRVFGKSDTVVRGGFGLYFYNSMPYGAAEGLGFVGSYSNSYLANINPSPVLGPSVIPAAGLALPPRSALTPTFGDVGTPFATSSMTFYYPNRAMPYALQYNLELQHQWKQIFFEAGYIGTFGRHNPISNLNVNLVPPNLLSDTAVPVQLRRPYTELNGSNATLTSYADSNFTSNYDALALKSERRYSNGFSWIAAFSWSKWVDNGNLVENTGGATSSPNLQNIYNRAGEQALSMGDIPLRLVFSPIVELPFGKGKHWLNQGGAVNQLVGGWETAVMGTYQNGSPIGLTVNGGGTILGDVNQTLRPNVVAGCNPNSGSQWQPATAGRGIQYINSSCFTVPGSYTYGNASRELPNIKGPGVAQLNLMVSKNFYFKERYRIQFRAEAVDLFNTPQFADPATTVNGSNFGVITGTDGFTRRIMDFGLKFYF